MSDNYEKQYNPTEWISDDVISGTRMNNIERGIADAYEWMADLETTANNATTAQQVETIISSKGYATTSQLPTKVSDLTNDVGYITEEQVPEGFFIATYGTTTYAEISTAYDAGKLIVLKTANNQYALLSYKSSSAFGFEYIDMLNDRMYRIIVNNSNQWSTAYVAYVPSYRKINNKDLSENITLTAADVDATTSAQVQDMIDTAIAAIPVADQTVYSQSNS